MKKPRPPDLEEVNQILARREYAEYCKYVHRGRWIPGKHLLFICADVEKLLADELFNEKGERVKVLILSIPPQHGKSMSTTETLPSYYVGKNPNKRVIIISYGDDLARSFGRRNKMKIEEFGKVLFDIELDRTRKSDTDFEVAGKTGSVISRGIMAGITGQPADLIVIDDPIKNRQEADSDVYRARIWEEWQNSIKTRLSANGKVILIQTRWHEDDLAGRIVLNEKGVKVINLPCEAEDEDPLGRPVGNALFPEIGKNNEWLAEFKESYVNDPNLEGGGIRAWNALFQGRPTPIEGSMLKRQWWRFYDKVPENFVVQIQSWDLAFKDLDTSDFVVGQVWGKIGSQMYLLDQIRARLDLPATLTAIENMSKRWPKAYTKLVEDKANGPAVIQMLSTKVGGMIAVNPSGGKVSRASAVSPAIEAGNVYLPSKVIASWISEFIDECAAFPNGKFDDQVDAMTQALNRFMYFYADLPHVEKRDPWEDNKPEHDPWLGGEADRSYIDYGG